MRFLLIPFLWALIAGLPFSSPAQDTPQLTPADLINAINTARVAYGLPALEVDPILMSTAQSTAEIMAINSMSWHIGDVRGRVMAAGYGGGATAWATENFAVGSLTVDQLMSGPWADSDHMIPVVSPNYRHIGAGVAEYNGRVYYVVHAAYTSGGQYTAPQATAGAGAPPDPNMTVTPAVSQLIVPVETATPDADGLIFHEVKSGQSLWAIAIAYHTHIADVQAYNNMLPENSTVYIGQKLRIPDLKNLVAPTPEMPAERTAIALINTPGAQEAEAQAAAPSSVPGRPTRTPLPRFTPTPTTTIQASGLPDAPSGHLEQAVLTGLGAALGIGLLLIFAGVILRRGQS